VHKTNRAALLAVVGILVGSCSTTTPPATTTSPSHAPGPANVDAVTDTMATTTTSSPPPTPTTTASPTTTADTATTTADVPTSGPFVVVWEDLTLAPPSPLAGSEGASGSGCEPGGDDLPDGIWFGYLLAEDPSNATIRFDLACLYFGEVAWTKAAEEGEEANNDLWIVNQSDKIRTLEYPAKATVWTITGDPTEGHFPRLLITEWPEASAYLDCPGENCGVWLYINDGSFNDIVEQYVP